MTSRAPSPASSTPTATEIVAAVQGGQLTARRAVEDALERIEARDGRIGAFQEVRVFRSLEEADRVDGRDDKDVLPLAGLPIAVKDNVPVEGEPMRQGSAGSDPSIQVKDHEVVRRLRDAGAVVVGITRVPELCVFGATDSVYGITHNPWDTARTPGGSSGGSAAAVAAGMVPVAHGNDGMGSIRIPSACCGLVGIKPGLGVVPSDLGDGSWFDDGRERSACHHRRGLRADAFGHGRAVPAGFARSPPPARRIAVSTKVFDSGGTARPAWAAAAHETGDLLRDAGTRCCPGRPAVRSADLAVGDRALDGRHRARALASSPTAQARSAHPTARRARPADVASWASRAHEGRSPVATNGGVVLRRP